MSKKTIITYGTFDLFHYGHLRLLERARELGDSLYVGVSTDTFNEIKGKKAIFSFFERYKIIRALKCVTHVFPEMYWNQKRFDIRDYEADILVMGDDWTGKFDDLKAYCEVMYLPRTGGISTSKLKERL